MEKYELYKKYKNILNDLNLSDGIKWGNIISIDLWSLKGLNYINIIKEIVRNLFLESINISVENNKKNIENLLIYSTPNRKDHKHSFDEVCSCIEDKSICIIERTKSINIGKIFHIKKIIENYKRLEKIDINLYRIFIALKITYYQDIAYKLLKKIENIEFNNLITYFDGCQIENMIVQLKREKVSITLQHGQYIYQSHNQNVNVIQYENFISDYMVVWGQATVDELNKYGINKNKLLVTGSPKFINNENCIIQERVSNDIFGILLNNEAQSESNYGLIKLANKISKQLGKKYIIKMHPSNNIEDYNSIIDKSCLLEILDKNKSVLEYGKMVEFSIVNTSSVYVELNCINSPVFRYKDENYLSMYDCDKDEFTSIDEFLEKYNTLINDYDSWKKHMYNISNYFVNGVGGTTQRYKEIIPCLNNR